MTDQFVVWTRYVRPDGRIVRHAYGPYPTRAKALTVVRQLTRQAEDHDLDLSRTEAYAVRLIPDRDPR